MGDPENTTKTANITLDPSKEGVKVTLVGNCTDGIKQGISLEWTDMEGKNKSKISLERSVSLTFTKDVNSSSYGITDIEGRAEVKVKNSSLFVTFSNYYSAPLLVIPLNNSYSCATMDTIMFNVTWTNSTTPTTSTTTTKSTTHTSKKTTHTTKKTTPTTTKTTHNTTKTTPTTTKTTHTTTKTTPTTTKTTHTTTKTQTTTEKTTTTTTKTTTTTTKIATTTEKKMWLRMRRSADNFGETSNKDSNTTSTKPTTP